MGGGRCEVGGRGDFIYKGVSWEVDVISSI